ncbi:hypothetical protein CP49_11760 [Bradyrhizobium valentinum]|uniref:Uncharacterized protein n=2 Tax=Bradyrhizobium valentinum TaxID=1518501 RepID=A0A0R3L1V2_9BRAD|nr:hypothetical protein CP49_11760 [Bradyrhizobium valentinum]
MLAMTSMRHFDRADWDMFAGCESRSPMIGEFDNHVIVLDGDLLNIIHADDEHGGQLFKLSDMNAAARPVHPAENIGSVMPSPTARPLGEILAPDENVGSMTLGEFSARLTSENDR